MRLTREQVVEHLTPPPGIVMPPYPARRDRLYRLTLAAIALGSAAEGAAVLSHIPGAAFFAQGWITAAILAASLTFLVWLKNWRYLVRGLALLGFVLWPLSSIVSWGFSLAAAAIMAAKETHCFHFPAGRILPWYSLALGVLLLFWSNHIAQGLGWLGLAFLWGWLVWDRSKLPLFEI